MLDRVGRSLNAALACLFLVAMAACTDQGPTDPGTLEPDFAKNSTKGGSDSGFSATLLGSPPWADAATAVAVNDAGLVVGQSVMRGRDVRGFVWAGDWVALSEAPLLSTGLAVSNGTTVYVGGWLAPQGTSLPARWTVSTSGGLPTVSAVQVLDPSGFGTVLGVNDQGAAVGSSLHQAWLWPLSGSPTRIDPPQGRGFTGGAAQDINNAGLVALAFRHPDYSRAFLRIPSGALVELAPQPGDLSSEAVGLGEVRPDGSVFVAGTTVRGTSESRPVRWRVHAQTGAILSTEVMSESGSVEATSDIGELAGRVEGVQGGAAVWPQSSAVLLPPPKGTSTIGASSISSSGEYVAGFVTSRLSSKAVLWSRKR
jgi:hypothetical protein